MTLGKAVEQFLPKGSAGKLPLSLPSFPVNIRQQTQTMKADCFSSDLQQVVADLRVLYRVPRAIGGAEFTNNSPATPSTA